MLLYLLIYSSPFEFNDNDSQDDSHDIGWTEESKELKIPSRHYSDKRLIRQAEEWAEKESKIICGQRVKPRLISLQRIIKKW